MDVREGGGGDLKERVRRCLPSSTRKPFTKEVEVDFAKARAPMRTRETRSRAPSDTTLCSWVGKVSQLLLRCQQLHLPLSYRLYWGLPHLRRAVAT
jgi:hypothetical protein